MPVPKHLLVHSHTSIIGALCMMDGMHTHPDSVDVVDVDVDVEIVSSISSPSEMIDEMIGGSLKLSVRHKI
eukprot:1970192-Amphidinium_carterae.1